MLTNKIVNQHFLCVYTKKSSKRTPLFYIWEYTKKRVRKELFFLYIPIYRKLLLSAKIKPHPTSWTLTSSSSSLQGIMQTSLPSALASSVGSPDSGEDFGSLT